MDKKTKLTNRDDLDARDVNYRRKTWIDYVGGANSLGFTFALNELDNKIEVCGERITDILEKEIYGRLHEINLPNSKLADQAMAISAKENSYHPIKKYLEGLAWNGEDTIQKLCGYLQDTHEKITYLDGCQRSMIHVGLLRWLVGAIAKVYEPIKAFNPVLILDGEEGKGKSYFVWWLCSDLPKYHYEGPIRPDRNDHLGYLATKFVWEISEIGSTINHSDRETLKDFLTKRDVTWRPAYGHYPLHKPALANWIGTVNFDGNLLNDPTGNRRFVPVEIASINQSYENDIQVSQIWAQAYHLYKSGEPWIMTIEEKEEKQNITENYETEDITASYIQRWFTIDPKNKDIHMLTIDILERLQRCVSADYGQKGASVPLAHSLKRLKLKRGRFGAKPNIQRGWWGISPNSRTLSTVENE